MRRAINRRLNIAAPEQPEPGAEVVFNDAWGEPIQWFAFDKLGLPADIAAILAEAFRHHYAGMEPNGRVGAWKRIKVFAAFVREHQIEDASELTTALVGRYLIWLDRQTTRAGQPWTLRVKAQTVGILGVLVNWTKRNRPASLRARIDLPTNPYPRSRETSRPRPRLGEPVLKVLLSYCYEEIDLAWARFEEGRAMLAGDRSDAAQGELAAVVRAVAAVENGLLPSAQSVLAAGAGLHRVNRLGGLRVIGGYLHLTTDALAAFYLALAVQLAANPEPLRMLRRDCLVAHPLEEEMVVVDWSKLRAGAKTKRAQRRAFDTRRPYAAPNLITKLIAMTAPLAEQAAPRDRGRLFLNKSEKHKAVAPLPMGTLHAAIRRLVARANAKTAVWNRANPARRREALPDLVPILLRGSVAMEHFRAAGGDIVAVQSVLNHASLATTEIYVRGPEARAMREATIARLQALMVAWIGGEPAASPDTASVDRATGFAHDCLRPTAGAAPGSSHGEVCPHLGGCLVCPGLVVPIDAEHLARLLMAKRQLEAARRRVDPHRFSLLYAPSLAILNEAILPDFPIGLYAQAHAVMPSLAPLPDLE